MILSNQASKAQWKFVIRTVHHRRPFRPLSHPPSHLQTLREAVPAYREQRETPHIQQRELTHMQEHRLVQIYIPGDLTLLLGQTKPF